MSDKTKVPIEMNPSNAMEILLFCRQFINERNAHKYKLAAIHEAVNELEQQLAKSLTDEHWEEIKAQNEINKLIGKVPG